MLMVVFGAGASYDSCPTHPAPESEFHGDRHADCRLPLGDKLFEERDLFFPILEQFPRALDVVPRLRHLLPGTNVEAVMEALRAEAEANPRRHRQLAAIRYYLQWAIWDCESEWHRRAAHGVTNYRSLLDLIDLKRKRDEMVCLVTFNYDTMLDTALPAVDIKISKIDDYIASSTYKVIKVHGSTNWGREIEPSMPNIGAIGDAELHQQLIEKAATWMMTDRFHVAYQRPQTRLDPHRPLVPAIAIPVQTKGAFECPADHIATLKDCLGKVTKLLVIGWRANDAHFLKLLHDGRQAIDAWVVAGKPEYANQVIENLKRGLDRPGKLQSGAGGFTQFMFNEAETFLDSF